MVVYVVVRVDRIDDGITVAVLDAYRSEEAAEKAVVKAVTSLRAGVPSLPLDIQTTPTDATLLFHDGRSTCFLWRSSYLL